MKQKYFITVTTRGPYNANRSTKTVCNTTVLKFSNTVVDSKASVDIINKYLDELCRQVNEKYPKNKSLRTDSWGTVSADGTKPLHIAVLSENSAFLQLDFKPVRHTYREAYILDELIGVEYDASTPITVKHDKLECKEHISFAAPGDVIVDEYDEIFVFLKNCEDYIIAPVTLSSVFGLSVEKRRHMLGNNDNFRYATQEERNMLFYELSVRGLRWNQETLETETIEL